MSRIGLANSPFIFYWLVLIAIPSLCISQEQMAATASGNLAFSPPKKFRMSFTPFDLSKYKDKNGIYEGHYKNGQIMEKGTLEKEREIGHWQYWYENGKLMADLDFRSNGEPSPMEIWCENGEKFFSGYFSRTNNGRGLQIVNVFTVFSPNGRPLVKGEAFPEEEKCKMDSYWPNGSLGMSANISLGHCGNGEERIFFDNGIPFFDHSRNSVGYGNSEGCQDSVHLYEKNLRQKIANERPEEINGPVTLFYPFWLSSFQTFQIKYLPKALTPCLVANYSKNKLHGEFAVFKPALTINSDQLLCSSYFEEGLPNGKMHFHCLQSSFESVFKDGIRNGEWQQNGNKIKTNESKSGEVWFAD